MSCNSNAYFTVRLPPGALEYFCEIANAIAEDTTTLLQLSNASDSTEGATCGIEFEPQEDLHVTYVFFGEALQGLLGKAQLTDLCKTVALQSDRLFPIRAVADLHRKEEDNDATVAGYAADVASSSGSCRKGVDSSPACREAAKTCRRVFGKAGGWAHFRILCFELFPPDKQNLIVARLAMDEETELILRRCYLWIHLLCREKYKVTKNLRGAPPEEFFQKACKKLVRTTGIEESAALVMLVWPAEEVVQFSQLWQPHITLGKLRAKKTDLGKISLACLNSSRFLGSEFYAPGIGLGGIFQRQFSHLLPEFDEEP